MVQVCWSVSLTLPHPLPLLLLFLLLIHDLLRGRYSARRGLFDSGALSVELLFLFQFTLDRRKQGSSPFAPRCLREEELGWVWVSSVVFGGSLWVPCMDVCMYWFVCLLASLF